MLYLTGMERQECIIGAGAVGLSLGAFFAKNAPPSLYAHPDQANAIRKEGITVTGDCACEIPPQALHLCTTPQELPHGTRYWICVKAFNVVELVGTLQHQLRSGTTILLANGLGLYNDIANVLGRSAIIRALPSYGAHRLTHTSVRVSGTPRFELASSPEDAAACALAQETLKNIGAMTTTIPSVHAAEWRKILVATSVTSLATLANQKNGIILECTALRALAEDVLAELRATALGSGVDLSDLPNDSIFRNLENHAGNVNSLFAALRAGLPTEIDYTLARPLLAARKSGITTPHLEVILRLLQCIEQNHLFRAAHV